MSESPDRNKTQTTREVTAHVVTWLNYHGFKPIETEVCVAPGWHADIAALIECTEGEAINLHLAPRKPNWKMADEKYRAMRLAFEDAYKALPSPVALCVEVKCSVSDLRGDRKWKEPVPAELCYVAITPELLSLALSIVPVPWGIVTVSARGVRVNRWAAIGRTLATEERFAIVYDIAIKRDHRTRHAALREAQKQARVVDNLERLTPQRWNLIARAVLTICKGGGDCLPYSTVEQVLLANRIPVLPGYVMDDLRKLWGVANREQPTQSGSERTELTV